MPIHVDGAREKGVRMSNLLPLVRLSLVRPIVAGMRERSVDPEPVLEAAGLTLEAVFEDGATVHVAVIHQFLELAAEAVGDPSFSVRIGEALDTDGWPMIARALDQACSLAEFLSIYVSGANTVSSSVTAYLEVRGPNAVFGETRLFRPSIRPAQNDGFMVGLALSVLRRALGERLNASKMTLVLCDPKVLPPDMDAFQALTGDEMGFRIQFPSEWLAYSVGKHTKCEIEVSGHANQTPMDFLSGFRSLLAQSVPQGGATADQAADLASMSRSRLARLLKMHGTSITVEIDKAKLSFAEAELATNSASIEEIAARLGYADPSNFARWFKRARGATPSAFRRQCVASAPLRT